MANEVNRQINIFINSGEAQKALDALLKKETALKNELAAATDPKHISKLKLEIDKLQEPIARTTKKVSGELGPSIKDLQKTVAALGNQLKRMSTEDADFSKVVTQYREANEALRQQQAELKKVDNAKKEVTKDGGGFSGSFFGNLAANAVTK